LSVETVERSRRSKLTLAADLEAGALRDEGETAVLLETLQKVLLRTHPLCSSCKAYGKKGIRRKFKGGRGSVTRKGGREKGENAP
jgi:hypothetical protein